MRLQVQFFQIKNHFKLKIESIRNFYEKGRIQLGLVLFGWILICSMAKDSIILENKQFKYVISDNGINKNFIYKKTGLDYLLNNVPSYCSFVTLNGEKFYISHISLNKNQLKLFFKQIDLVVELTIIIHDESITLKVNSINKNIESLNFLNIPLRLKGVVTDPLAVCALSLNVFTQVNQLPALQTHLWAACYKKFGIKNAAVAIVCVPTIQILPAIRKIISHAKDIPSSSAGGAWAQLNKGGYGSYLMNFGTLTENTVGEWIEMCKNVGFNQIDSHGSFDNRMGNSFFRFGDFQLNTTKWPIGWDSFRNINQKLHEAGISSILHTYAFFIDKNSKYVTPIPSPDLGYQQKFTLTDSISSDNTNFIVNESTIGMYSKTGWNIQNSNTLRIGQELITFSNVTDKAPYIFSGCKRGAYGTSSTFHFRGEIIYHLKEMFGLFVPDPETKLFKEIAIQTAAIVNRCKFDGIYLDAIDGTRILNGEEFSWYYGTKFIFEIAKHLDHPVGMEMSAMYHLWWHYRSRWQAWDSPTRGYKRFVDIHIAEIKNGTDSILKSSNSQYGRLLLPLQLGWWRHQTWDPPQNEPTFTDDIEYLCCKMIANNAGISIISGFDKATLKNQPAFSRLNSIIQIYEELGQKHYFNDSICQLLRIPGNEFKLIEENGKWNFKPVVYHKHKISSIDQHSSSWIINNKYKSQSLKLRIESLISAKSYDDKANILICDNDTDKFHLIESANGVFGKITKIAERTPSGEPAISFVAKNSGYSSQNNSRIGFEKKFHQEINLENNQGIGLWVKGDGSGQVLCIRVMHPELQLLAGNGDRFIYIDFIGWRYFELIELESSNFNNYIWSVSDNRNFYRTFINKVQFATIEKLQLWYNNIRENQEISCLIGPIKALPLIPYSIKNPTIIINGHQITFPVSLESGMYLEILSDNKCMLFGQKGEFIKNITPNEPIPFLQTGKNQISFTCESQIGVNPRAQVTIINEGDPL